MMANQKAIYFFDFLTQKFGNAFSFHKQPIAFVGSSEAVVSAEDPKMINFIYRVSNGEFFTIGEVDYQWGSAWVMRPVTHVMKIKILALPQPGQKELIYTFLSDKTIPVSITHDKRFVVGSDSEVFTTKQFNFPLNQYIYLRLVYTRMKYTERYYDCSVEIGILGHGRDGGDLKCRNNNF